MATLDYSPVDVDLILYQGDDWSKTFRLGSRPDADSPVEYWDLTGWTGLCQIRTKASSTEVLATLTVTIGPDQDAAETAGYFTVTLDAEDSADLPRRCFWDLELTDDSGFKRTFAAGTVEVVREISRSV